MRLTGDAATECTVLFPSPLRRSLIASLAFHASVLLLCSFVVFPFLCSVSSCHRPSTSTMCASFRRRSASKLPCRSELLSVLRAVVLLGGARVYANTRCATQWRCAVWFAGRVAVFVLVSLPISVLCVWLLIFAQRAE